MGQLKEAEGSQMLFCWFERALVSSPSPSYPDIVGKFCSAHKYFVSEGFVMYLTNAVRVTAQNRGYTHSSRSQGGAW